MRQTIKICWIACLSFSLITLITLITLVIPSSADAKLRPTSLDKIRPSAALEMLEMDPNAPACEAAYVSNYLYLAGQLEIVASYVKLGQTPPNLSDTLSACAKIEERYHGMTCNVLELQATAKTSDLRDGCAGTRQIFLNVHGHEPLTQPLSPADVKETSALIYLEPSALKFRVNNLSLLQSTLASSDLQYLIDGKVYGLAESLKLVNASVRCTLIRGVGASLTNEQLFAAVAIDETFQAGYRRAVIQVTTSGAASALSGVDCTSQTGDNLSLGGLRSALQGLFEIKYEL